MTASGLIFQQIPKIMADVEPISKDRKNVQQGYSFRGVDDVYAALQAIMAKHGVFTVPDVLEERSEERTSKSGTSLIYRILRIRYWFFATDGSFFETVVIGEGQDSGDKASNKAMSVAHKYALLQVFMIPTVEPKDPEHDSHELEPKPKEPRNPDRGAPAPPPPEKYDPRNEEHKTRIIAQLEARHIPSDKWDDIGFEMRGKTMTAETLAAAIKKILK